MVVLGDQTVLLLQRHQLRSQHCAVRRCRQPGPTGYGRAWKHRGLWKCSGYPCVLECVPGYPLHQVRQSGLTCLYHTRGIRGRSFPQVLFAVAFAMAISYRGLELPQSPVSDGTLPKCKRNAEIRARHQQGESIAMLAEIFGITEQRIWQILNDRRK